MQTVSFREGLLNLWLVQHLDNHGGAVGAIGDMRNQAFERNGGMNELINQFKSDPFAPYKRNSIPVWNLHFDMYNIYINIFLHILVHEYF